MIIVQSFSAFSQNLGDFVNTALDILAPLIIENSSNKAETQQVLGLLKDATKYASDYNNLSNNLQAAANAHIQNGAYIQNPNNKDYALISIIFQQLLSSPHIPKSGMNWQIYLDNTDDINAFALPNGAVIVNKGFIDFCRNDDELALAIGHEIAHITLQHALEQAKQALASQTIVDQLNKHIGYTSNAEAQAFNKLFGLGGGMALLKFSRDDEREADRAGAIYAASVGYNTIVGYNFWTRIAALQGSGTLAFLQKHPSSAERANAFLTSNIHSTYYRTRTSYRNLLEFYDSFDNPSSGWASATINEFPNGYLNGQYYLSSAEAVNGVYFFPAPYYIGPRSSIFIDIIPYSGINESNIIEVQFNLNENGSSIPFTILFTREKVFIAEMINDSWTIKYEKEFPTLHSWRLNIVRVDQIYQINIDGIEYFRFQVSNTGATSICLTNAHGGVNVIYDNFIYYSLH
ncbi:M48 family metallopeptidase [Brucepastera parasyntrophica]|uniref:M48 family metallopeptidase n=1 Tax=Brucepastera parasyntrophica TaxID=2880008 RepID=UPI002109C2B4|nr:M48 family metallopeptidase [Brucepastera parasyntrophica]ULQ58897.1 M48 family metallopeptidase [Brucepastera parasyntrophica]